MEKVTEHKDLCNIFRPAQGSDPSSGRWWHSVLLRRWCLLSLVSFADPDGRTPSSETSTAGENAVESTNASSSSSPLWRQL